MLRVPDLERSKAFYGDVLGFDVQTPAEDLFFFSVGSTLIVLRPPLEGTPEGDRFSEQRVGVDHLAFAVETRQELENALVILQEAEIHTEGIERDPTLDRDYIAFRDPDNVQLEFYMI
jgi:catechol 2,3-dioxygenase-like lactoylglutathione lyase family enzyme